MKIQIAGKRGPLAAEVERQLRDRGHSIEAQAPCVIFFPGAIEDLQRIVAGAPERIVLRSYAGAYGANPKNPGLMTETRISFLPASDPAHLYIQAEEIVARHSNAIAVRFATVANAQEGDFLAAKLAAGTCTRPAGRDPNVQFIRLEDAAHALVYAAESDATGLFNAAGEGAVRLKSAIKASGSKSYALPETMGLRQLAYNWTVSSDRFTEATGWKPKHSSLDALREFLQAKKDARPERLLPSYDDWGMDVDYIRAWGWWFAFLRNHYWRIEFEGMENIPRGKALLVSNHRGFMPLDAVMHLSLIFTHTGRVPRFLINHILLRTPFMCNFLTKLGGVVASQENATLLFRNDSLVAMFPEGIRGTFTPYKQTTRLRDFTKSGFTKMAVKNQAPIVPAAVVGHSEIFPIIGRIDSSFVVKEIGWPYLPVAPPFPLAPVPLPSKWHIRILPEVPLNGLTPEDAENDRLMKSFARYIQDIVQKNINDMAGRRKHIFWGKVLDGTAPKREPFHIPATLHRAAGPS